MINLKYFIFNPLRARCSVLWDETGECVIADPTAFTDEEKDELQSFIEKKSLKPVAVILTHAHFDHVYGVSGLVKKFGVPVYMNSGDRDWIDYAKKPGAKADIPLPEIDFETVGLDDGSEIGFGNSVIEVIHTPGHSEGGVCFLCRNEKILLSGDTLFAGTIGRTDLPGGDYDKLMTSIMTKLMVLDGDIDVLPGHGMETTIADERLRNPFLQPFNEAPGEDEA